jgi:hypothetical protein
MLSRIHEIKENSLFEEDFEPIILFLRTKNVFKTP